ncbi:MAG: hypothetical protein KF745_13025 [Phycisphaeraceae bacterium]|nr:hypothetical protein [Phycisphaeraceae bacterium]
MAAGDWILTIVAAADPVRRDAKLLAGTLLVIVVLLLAIILLIVQRVVRMRIMRSKGGGQPGPRSVHNIDPWFEAGRRAKPIEVPGEDEGEHEHGLDDEPEDPQGPRNGRGGGVA